MTWQDLTIGVLEVFAEHRSETFSRRVSIPKRDYLVVGPWQVGCRFCGQPRREGHTACEYHADYHADYSRRLSAKRAAAGVCVSCRAPATKNQDGTPQRRCSRCAERERARRRRAGK